MAVACIRIACFATSDRLAVETPECQSLWHAIGSNQITECFKVVRTLLLDLDGTLVDTAPDVRAALNRLMRSRGLAAVQPAADGGDDR